MVQESRPAIDVTRLDLAREFKRNPFAKHSPDLYALLEILRGPRFNGNYVLVQLEAGKRYVLAVKQPGGKPPTVLSNEVFARAEDAEWAVFKRRWEAAAGQPLPVE
jgi:hypothetical protein